MKVFDFFFFQFFFSIFRMLDAIKKSKHIIKTAAEYLLLADKSTYTYNDATALFDVVGSIW